MISRYFKKCPIKLFLLKSQISYFYLWTYANNTTFYNSIFSNTQRSTVLYARTDTGGLLFLI